MLNKCPPFQLDGSDIGRGFPRLYRKSLTKHCIEPCFPNDLLNFASKQRQTRAALSALWVTLPFPIFQWSRWLLSPGNNFLNLKCSAKTFGVSSCPSHPPLSTYSKERLDCARPGRGGWAVPRRAYRRAPRQQRGLLWGAVGGLLLLSTSTKPKSFVEQLTSRWGKGQNA